MAGLGDPADLPAGDVLDIVHTLVVEAAGGPHQLMELEKRLNQDDSPPDPDTWGEDAQAQQGQSAMMTMFPSAAPEAP